MHRLTGIIDVYVQLSPYLANRKQQRTDIEQLGTQLLSLIFTFFFLLRIPLHGKKNIEVIIISSRIMF